MRKNKITNQSETRISILTVDDDPIITVTIQNYFTRSGYEVDIENDPMVAIERVRNGSYDIMLLDFLMSPVCGDRVVEEIRKFNTDIYIVLLTGHKSMAPPVKTIRQLDIQGYYEKNDKFDQLELLVESCVKSIKQLRAIREYRDQLSKAYMQTIETLRSVVETRDKETRGHSERVSALAHAIALEMGLASDECENIRVAGLFHDIGKIGVPDAILLKNGRLSDEEYEAIKKHPEEGASILSAFQPFDALIPIVAQHHERWDGMGYPKKIAGDDICIGARITAVADSFDAMVSNRTYRSGLSFDAALQELERCSGTQFDPAAVKGMIGLVERMGRETFEGAFCGHTDRKEGLNI